MIIDTTGMWLKEDSFLRWGNKEQNVNSLISYRYYEAVLKNSTGPWSAWGSKSHSYTWEVFIFVNLARDQKNPGHDPDRTEHRLCKLWEIRPLNIQFTNL